MLLTAPVKLPTEVQKHVARSEAIAREPFVSLAMRSVFRKVKVNGELVSRLEPTSYEQMEQMLDNASWLDAVRVQLQKWEGTNTLGDPYPLSHILSLGIEKKDIGRLIWVASKSNIMRAF